MSVSLPVRLLGVAIAGTAVVALAACGAPVDEAGSSGSSSASASASATCDPASMKTKTAGTLTVGTDKPAYEPWFSDDDPSNGKGYESAVAYAIADKLGYAKDKVTWVVAPFNTVITPGEKDFDMDLNQVSISDERKNAVDFSSGYYDVRQAVITYKGSPIDGTTSVADLKDAKLGAQVGTTSYIAVKEQIKPDQTIAVFDTNDLAVQALKNKQIDGIVADLPTAFYMTAAQLDDGVIVGQLPAEGSTPEQFGAVLDKGSPLTACISQAVDALRADGTLDTLGVAVAVDPGRARAEVARHVGGHLAADGTRGGRRGRPVGPVRAGAGAAGVPQRRARRSSVVAVLSTAALVGLAIGLIVTSPGWERVKETFFSWDKAVDSFPAVLEGLWLNIRIMLICAVLIAIFGLTLAVMRTIRGPVAFPLRLFATAYVDLFRGLAAAARALPPRLRRPGPAAVRACRPRRCSGVPAPWCCPTRPTSPRSSGPASSRCTPRSAPRPARSGSRTARRCATSCCPRPCAGSCPR